MFLNLFLVRKSIKKVLKYSLITLLLCIIHWFYNFVEYKKKNVTSLTVICDDNKIPIGRFKKAMLF